MDIDVRWKYIETANPGLKNGVIIYYIGKYSGQGGSPTLSSPVMIRLAEVYLNRAEAYAKIGDVDDALSDVNEIRTNRMVVPDGGTFMTIFMMLHGGRNTTDNILDIVLKERRIELLSKGIGYDLVRNGRDLVRNYWGYHLDSRTVSREEANQD